MSDELNKKCEPCPFCNIDYKDISNTIIEETENFIVIPSRGSLVVGYVIVVPKQHCSCINELNELQKEELKATITKYRQKFFNEFGKYPIIFEHGTNIVDSESSASSIVHAHLHIVNHDFKNEELVINKLSLQQVGADAFYKNKNKSYISYIAPDFKHYITYNYNNVSQQVRIFIAEDLNIKERYNWRRHDFKENIIETIKLFK